MPEKGIISLDEAQAAAERFLDERFKGLRKISIDKVKLDSIKGIVVYDVAGTAIIGGSFFTRRTECPFKIQVAATDGVIVGYEM
jgi:hypothetical protein